MLFAKSHGEREVLENALVGSSVVVVVIRDDVKTRVAFNGKKTRVNRHCKQWKLENCDESGGVICKLLIPLYRSSIRFESAVAWIARDTLRDDGGQEGSRISR